MRTLILIFIFGLFSLISFSQNGEEITEKRNVQNKKGDAYFERNEFEKAILFYNMAFQKDDGDYFSILKKAEAFTKLKLYPQAEQCYKIVFDQKLPVKNVYKLKYALVLHANNKPEEFKHWLGLYSQVIENEIEGENYLISSENRVKLYKDTAIVLVSKNNVIDTIKFKKKYAGYQPRKRISPEDNQITLLVSDGEEYTIAANEANNFEFSFQPMEDYKLIIQRENIIAENIIADEKLSDEQRKREFLNPSPIQEAELKLQKGLKYQFSSGQSKISSEYLNALKEQEGKYQNADENAVDLTALVKELQLTDGDIYTISFVKSVNPDATYKKMEISSLVINEQAINIFGRSFLVVLPDRAKENFAIKTNLDALKKDYKPGKYALHVDNKPMFIEEESTDSDWLMSLTVNTSLVEDVKPGNRLSAEEISIIPGTEYLLTLSKPNPRTGRNIEIIVPLTSGVKYNLTTAEKSDTDYKEALAEFLVGREKIATPDEEVIDISILSKELEVKPGEDITFSLSPPVRRYGNQPAISADTKSSLTVDERIIELSPTEKYLINVPFNDNRTINIQTDLEYVQQNFADEAFNLRLDTISFTSEITVDTTGYNELKSTGWLSMSINTESVEEVAAQDNFMAKEVSIIPGKEYILTVSKIDAKTKKKEEIIIPLIRDVKYDFTSHPESEMAYQESLEEFLAGREDIKTTEGTLIDITLLSKELQIEEGDEVSFSLLPVKKLPKIATQAPSGKSSLFLDNKVVEFTYIHKYTINMPLNEDGQVNMQTNIAHLQKNFDPGSYKLDLDTASFFSEITIDTTGLSDRIVKEEEVITDPVFDVVIVNFDVNAHLLKENAKQIIQKSVIDELKDDTRLYVTVKGYTDALGDADYNLNLSKKRAESVNEFLKSNGIGEERIRTFSFGESESLKEGVNWEDLSDEELKKHRKVEIVIYLPE